MRKKLRKRPMDSTDKFFLVMVILLVVVMFGWYVHHNGFDRKVVDQFNELRSEEVMLPGVYAKSMINGEELLIPVVEENLTAEDLERGLEAGVLVEVK